MKAQNIEKLTQFNAFDDDFKLFSTGQWMAIDNHTRWIGSMAAVIIPLKKDSISLTLLLTASPLTYPEKLDKQTMQVYANDALVKTIEFTEKSSHEIPIELNQENKEQPVIIKLVMPDAAAPADFVKSRDKRQLSLLLSDFRVVEHVN
ncbi:MAG: hypothetical protein L3J52_10430 [Proteobacteria bacterium]|nr:hypothetical protein [Pseudomonadota bacterium]